MPSNNIQARDYLLAPLRSAGAGRLPLARATPAARGVRGLLRQRDPRQARRPGTGALRRRGGAAILMRMRRKKTPGQTEQPQPRRAPARANLRSGILGAWAMARLLRRVWRGSSECLRRRKAPLLM
jgi:hypothetical protein